jgi:hypothetical protein
MRSLVAFVFLAVSCVPDATAPVAASVCQAAAIAKANAFADRECGAYDSWEACPESKEIEAILLADLEACDGDS